MINQKYAIEETRDFRLLKAAMLNDEETFIKIVDTGEKYGLCHQIATIAIQNNWPKALKALPKTRKHAPVSLDFDSFLWKYVKNWPETSFYGENITRKPFSSSL